MVVERNVIEQWLAMFGYDETIETPFDINKSNLDNRAKQIISVLTYPKIVITESDLMYLRNFWHKKSSEMSFLYKICENIMLSEYNIIPIVGHHIYTSDLVYVTTNIDNYLFLKAIIIPEDKVSDTVEMNKLARNYSDLLKTYQYPVKYGLEDDRKQESPVILFIEYDNWINYYKKVYDKGTCIGEIYVGIDAIFIKIGDRLVVSNADPLNYGEQHVVESTINDVGMLVKIVSMNSYKKDLNNSLSNIRREYVNNRAIL